MDHGTFLALRQFDDANEIEFIRSNEKRGMRGVDRLIGIRQAGNRAPELALLEPVQAQSGLVKQQYGVGMPAGRFGEKNNKK